ncbi:MAG: hypothetical protein ABW170_09135 [Candidatus Thiodiazotropha sp. L084R]
MKDVLIGVISAALGGIVVFLGSSSMGLFEKKLTDSQIQEVSKSIVDIESTRNVLLEKMSKSEKFRGPKGERGEIGERGNEGPPGPAAWPEGQYCIVSNGSCPSGFQKTDGYIRALAIFPNGDRSTYIKETSPKIGGIFIQCHGKCDKSDEWVGEIIVSTCCK